MTSIEWRLRQVVPAAAVTTHAKPHAQPQLAHDHEEERAAMGQRCRINWTWYIFWPTLYDVFVYTACVWRYLICTRGYKYRLLLPVLLLFAWLCRRCWIFLVNLFILSSGGWAKITAAGASSTFLLLSVFGRRITKYLAVVHSNWFQWFRSLHSNTIYFSCTPWQ